MIELAVGPRERHVAEDDLAARRAIALAALLREACPTAIALRAARARVERLVRHERARAGRADERLGRPVEDRAGEELVGRRDGRAAVRRHGRAAVRRAEDGRRRRARVLLLPAVVLGRQQRLDSDIWRPQSRREGGRVPVVTARKQRHRAVISPQRPAQVSGAFGCTSGPQTGILGHAALAVERRR